MRAQAEAERTRRRQIWDGNPHDSDTHFGTITVLRGEVDLTTFTDNHRRQMADHPGVAHVVFTNRIGQHHLRREGDLLAVGMDITKAGELVNEDFGGPLAQETLADYAARLRTHATQQLERADQYLAMANDGWELVDCHQGAEVHDGLYGGDWVWNLRDSKRGPSYAPLPPKA